MRWAGQIWNSGRIMVDTPGERLEAAGEGKIEK